VSVPAVDPEIKHLIGNLSLTQEFILDPRTGSQDCQFVARIGPVSFLQGSNLGWDLRLRLASHASASVFFFDETSDRSTLCEAG
jgi:hypothetical protein